MFNDLRPPHLPQTHVSGCHCSCPPDELSPETKTLNEEFVIVFSNGFSIVLPPLNSVNSEDLKGFNPLGVYPKM